MTIVYVTISCYKINIVTDSYFLVINDSNSCTCNYYNIMMYICVCTYNAIFVISDFLHDYYCFSC